MHYGSQQQAHERDEYNATEKRVDGRKYFRASIRKRVDGPHAAQYHRCLEQRVDPVEPGKPVVAADADEQSSQQQKQPQAGRSDHSLEKDRQRRQLFMTSFEHKCVGIQNPEYRNQESGVLGSVFRILNSVF